MAKRAAPKQEDPERAPQRATCEECLHTWTAYWLPMAVYDVFQIVKGLYCPKCSANSKNVRLDP